MKQQEKMKGKGCPIKWAVVSGRSQLGVEQQGIVDGMCTLDKCAWFEAEKRDCRVNLWADAVMENVELNRKTMDPLLRAGGNLEELSKTLSKDVEKLEQELKDLPGKPPEGGNPS